MLSFKHMKYGREFNLLDQNVISRNQFTWDIRISILFSLSSLRVTSADRWLLKPKIQHLLTKAFQNGDSLFIEMIIHPEENNTI